MNDIRLSVVVPAYNTSTFIGECLRSVLDQDNAPSFEVIVVDDGSTDFTYDVVARNFPEVRLFHKPNGGAGSARNFGVDRAYGDIVVFIDSDDIMLPGRLAYQGSFMLANPQYGLTFGNARYQTKPDYDVNRGRGVCISEEFVGIPHAYERLLVEGNYIANPTSAVRKAVYVSSGGQPEDKTVAEDYAMCCEIARKWPIAASCRYFTWYRQGHGGNLMASSYAYTGTVYVLREHLLTHSKHLTKSQYRQAFRRWCHMSNMLLRWSWITRGRHATLASARSLRPLLPRRLQIKWAILSGLPQSWGLWARRAYQRARRLALRKHTAART